MRDLLAVLLVSLPWLLLIGGGVAMCVLYERGERIDAVGYIILAVMAVPVLGTIVVCLWWRCLDVDCTGCGRPFFSSDLPTIRQTGRCPACGRAVELEDFEDGE